MLLYKKSFLIGVAFYIVYIILAIFFYKERTIFTDISYHLFEIIRNNGFAIQNYRFVAVVTQVFPLLSYKAGWALKDVMLLYSMSFVLFYFICYLVCGLLLRNYKWALVLLLFNILFATHTFYWIQSELPQGMAVMIVMWAYIDRDTINKTNRIHVVVISLMLIIVAFAHPLLIFPFIYCSLFLLLNNQIPKKIFYYLLSFFVVVIGVKSIAFRTTYDTSTIGNAIKNFNGSFIHIYSNKRFLLNCIDKYYWIPICSIGIGIYYLIKKAWLLLILFGGAMLGYILLVDISYPTSYTTDFYIENLYLPLGIFIAVPFVCHILPLLDNKRLAYMLVSLVAVTGCIRVYANHTFYTNRLNWERSFLNKHIKDKLFIDEKNIPMDTLLMTWGTPYEFWLLSTTEYGKTASIVINNDLNTILWAKDLSNQFVPTWGAYPYSQLPPQYFVFTDSISSYRVDSLVK